MSSTSRPDDAVFCTHRSVCHGNGFILRAALATGIATVTAAIIAGGITTAFLVGGMTFSAGILALRSCPPRATRGWALDPTPGSHSTLWLGENGTKGRASETNDTLLGKPRPFELPNQTRTGESGGEGILPTVPYMGKACNSFVENFAAMPLASVCMHLWLVPLAIRYTARLIFSACLVGAAPSTLAKHHAQGAILITYKIHTQRLGNRRSMRPTRHALRHLGTLCNWVVYRCAALILCTVYRTIGTVDGSIFRRYFGTISVRPQRAVTAVKQAFCASKPRPPPPPTPPLLVRGPAGGAAGGETFSRH